MGWHGTARHGMAKAYEAGGQGDRCPPNDLNLEKLGKILLNYTKIRTIFTEIIQKTGNLNS